MILAPGVGLDSEKNPEVPTEGTETSLKEGEKKILTLALKEGHPWQETACAKA